MSKVYNSKSEFARDTLQYLRERVLTEPLRLEVTHVIVGAGGDGEGGWATVEMKAVQAKCKNGMFSLCFCDLVWGVWCGET